MGVDYKHVSHIFLCFGVGVLIFVGFLYFFGIFSDHNCIVVCGVVLTNVHLFSLRRILSVMVVFKHIRVSKRLALLLTTCQLSAKSLLSMMLITLIFVLGFTLALYIGFGHRVYGLRSMTNTFVTLLFRYVVSFAIMYYYGSVFQFIH